MRLLVNHTTTYEYDRPVDYALQQLRLTPKSRAGQTVLKWDTHIEGGQKELEFDDQHGNRVQLISFEPGAERIVVHCDGEVETNNGTGIIGTHGGYAPLWYFMRETALTKPGPNIRKIAREARQKESDLDTLHHLSQSIKEMVKYETGRTDSETNAEDATAAGHGVCQDHAHIFISCARSIGYPARYVSGYLLMHDRTEQDASHAWAEAHVPDLGWVGFDVSNGISPDETYIRVATGLDYVESAPISGMRFGESEESMVVTLQVQQ